MTKEEFDAKLARGLAQAKAGDGIPTNQFFDTLKEELNLILKGEKPMKTIHTENAPAAIGPYSQAMVVNGLVYTSGQIALNPQTGALAGDSIEAQTEQAIQNLKAVLEAAGSGLNNVVKTTCFLQRMSDFSVFNGIYEKHFPGKPCDDTAQECYVKRNS